LSTLHNDRKPVSFVTSSNRKTFSSISDVSMIFQYEISLVPCLYSEYYLLFLQNIIRQAPVKVTGQACSEGNPGKVSTLHKPVSSFVTSLNRKPLSSITDVSMIFWCDISLVLTLCRYSFNIICYFCRILSDKLLPKSQVKKEIQVKY